MDRLTTGRSKAPPLIASAVRLHGRTLVTNLTFAIKTARLYSFAHSNVAAALNEFKESLSAFTSQAGSALHLLGMDDSLSLNEVRLKPDFSSAQSFQFILDLLKANDVGELSIQPAVGREELEALVTLFNTHRPNPDEPWTSFAAAAAKLQLPNIGLARTGERKASLLDDKNGRIITMGIYFKTISHVDAVLGAVRSRKPLHFRQLKHAIQTMVDITLCGEHVMLSLANVKGYGEPGSNHAVNVAIFSIALGLKLGLPKKHLGDLGMAALLHDIGKANLPEHLRSVGQHDVPSSDADAYASHVHAGMDALLSEHIAESCVRSINVALLHHYRFDRTGFPRLLTAKEQDLFTRIVAVADFYDNATTPQQPVRPAMEAERVMHSLLDGSGTEFDPIVVKAFVNLMGLYPVGSMVRLNTGELAIVLEPPTNPRFLDRPRIKLLSDSMGNPVEEFANLLDLDSGGRFRRSILKLCQMEQVQLDLGEYLTVI